MSILEIIICVLIVIGIFFTLAGVIGVIRMPDTFCRIQSATNIATIFLLISNPVGSHAMARAAYKNKAHLCDKTKFDHYRRDIDE